MWDKVIGLLIGKAIRVVEKETAPRTRLSKAFVELYRALTECHGAWLAMLARDGDTQELVEYWAKGLVRLSKAINKVRVLLGIHEPELLSGLATYGASETYLLKVFTSQSAEIQRISRALESNLPEAYTHKGSKADGFDELLSQLQKFMRTKLKLKPEEIIIA
jgi:hypothetical protein